MTETKGEKAARMLRELADLLDTLPRRTMSTSTMRDEASWYERQSELWKTASEPVEDSPIGREVPGGIQGVTGPGGVGKGE